jgi:hypothetical protein
MSEERVRCQGKTKAGKSCRNYAQEGSNYCHLHQDQAVDELAAAAAAIAVANEPAGAVKGSQAAQDKLEMLLDELNQLAGELQKRYPDYRPPSFSRQGLTDLVTRNLERFTPEVGVELVTELRANLEGTSPRDLLDPDTWKGLWYILNYTAQGQTTSARGYVAERLSSLPGMATVSDLKANLEGTSPKELLDPETWKGMYLIVNYSLQATARDLKRKVLGDEEES